MILSSLSPVYHGNSVRTHGEQSWTWGKGLCLVWLFKIMEATVVLEYSMQCGMKLGQRNSVIHPALFWILKWRIGNFKELEVLSVPKDDGGRWGLMISMTEEQKELVPPSLETISSQETFPTLTHHYCWSHTAGTSLEQDCYLSHFMNSGIRALNVQLIFLSMWTLCSSQDITRIHGEED